MSEYADLVIGEAVKVGFVSNRFKPFVRFLDENLKYWSVLYFEISILVVPTKVCEIRIVGKESSNKVIVIAETGGPFAINGAVIIWYVKSAQIESLPAHRKECYGAQPKRILCEERVFDWRNAIEKFK